VVLKASLALFENVLDISLSVHNSDDPKRGLLWPIHDDVVGVPAQRPETKRTGCEVGAGMAAHGSFGKKGASIEDGFFYAVGGILVVVRDVSQMWKISALARGVRT
jgi:hypothetical protein